MPRRRVGAVREGGQPVTLLGEPVTVGQPAPDFQCVRLDADTDAIVDVRLADTPARPRLFSVAPSLDTPVCAAQTRRFNEAVNARGQTVAAYSVSVDTPNALGRFCVSEGIANLTLLSDYRPQRSFATNWGLLIEETGELARAVFVVDAGGVVRYAQVVDDTWDHPDYDAALAALDAVLSATA
jgi:thioredoxin-dependent peroxiredoxin